MHQLVSIWFSKALMQCRFHAGMLQRGERIEIKMKRNPKLKVELEDPVIPHHIPQTFPPTPNSVTNTGGKIYNVTVWGREPYCATP